MTEAEFVAALRRLPLHSGAHGLTDDTATLGCYTITTDTLVEGAHYLAVDPPEDVAWKLLATNLSDLAAKGATPVGVLLNYPLRSNPKYSFSPAQAGVQSRNVHDDEQSDVSAATTTGLRPAPGKHDMDEDRWDTSFLAGLDTALTHFAIPILGGDTVSLPPHAPRVITLTAIGRDAPAPPRSGARAGDALYVTGTIGDAGAGLAIAKGAAGPRALLSRYRRPIPRLAEGRKIAPLAHAMMDVSDGLLLDASRMATASGLALTIDLAAVPLSPEYLAFAGNGLAARLSAATAGDDYELLFASFADDEPPAAAFPIGTFSDGQGLNISFRGQPVPLPPNLGYQHNL